MSEAIDEIRPDDCSDGRGYGPLPAVLMYHSVAPYHQYPYLVTVRPARFHQQLRWLDRCGLRGTSMRELLTARRESADRGLVGLTFDDGYADFSEHVLPALHRFGFTATVFAIADLLGTWNSWNQAGPRKAILQEVSGQEVSGFCYPYGHVDAAAVDAVRAAGYRYGCGIWPSSLTGLLALPRTYIGDRDGSLRLRAKWYRHNLRYRQYESG